MQPIHELLARIRWDAEFAKAQFVIGYWDRLAGHVLRADLRDIAWDEDNPTQGGHTSPWCLWVSQWLDMRGSGRREPTARRNRKR